MTRRQRTHPLPLLAASALCLAASPVSAEVRLSPVWGDHAVIQQGREVVVEGTAAPNATVRGTLGGATAKARAGADGRFALTFPARQATETPVVLEVSDGSGAPARATDLLTGDVWLCSGQSNMELPVSRSLDPEGRSFATDASLRLLTIPKDTAPGPMTEFGQPVAWTGSGPEANREFSAACLFMAQGLRRELKIPVGAIHSSWGGSQIRPWLSPEGGRALYGAEAMALLQVSQRDMAAAVAAFAPTWEDWWRKGDAGREPWKNPDVLQWAAVPAIAPWQTWTGTPLARDAIGNVFLRRTIELTPEQAKAGGTLAIGVIDDLDMTWVNGQPVGITHGWSTERRYAVPAKFLKPGRNEIIVAANNSWAGGGFTSTADRLSFTPTGGAAIPLGTGWRYAIGAIRGVPPRAPWDANAGIGVMHNRMIAPLGRFAMQGAAWYQGESDVGLPGYADRVRELVKGWRGQFGPNLRLLVVQLADYGPTASTPVESGWAELRDAQRRAVAADRNAALVATFDIGEPTDIHPANKFDLGKRLTLAALGRPMPMPARARRSGMRIVIDFSGIEGGLVSRSGAPLGLELCAETQDSCRYAAAGVDGNRLVLTDDGMPATRVRYAWADSPVVNLFDTRGLPVPGFELPIDE